MASENSGDLRQNARLIERHESEVIQARNRVHRLDHHGRSAVAWLRSRQLARRLDQNLTRNVHDVAHHRAARRHRSRSAAVQHDVLARIADDLNRVVHTADFCDRILVGNHRRMNARFGLPAFMHFRDRQQLEFVSQHLSKIDIERAD